MSYYTLEYSYSRPRDSINPFCASPREGFITMPWCLLSEVTTREGALDALRQYRKQRTTTAFGVMIFRAVLH